MTDYIETAADMVERTPAQVVFHRLTATAASNILLAPLWCGKKWIVIDGIAKELARRGSRQGSALAMDPVEQTTK